MIPLLIGIPEGDFWYWLMSAIGFPVMLLAFGALVGAWLIWERVITPQEARAIRSAKRNKSPLAFMFNDAGQGWFESFKRISSSGAASTTKKPNNRKGFLGFFARKTEPILMEPKDDPAQKLLAEDIAADNLAGMVDSLQTSKVYLKHSKLPINVVYTGKALITSFTALAGVELAQQIALTDGGEELTEVTCSYCGGKQHATRKVLKFTEKPPFINVSRFFKNLSDLTAWDESETKANETDHFYWGIDEEKKKANKNPLLMLLLAMGLCFGMAVLLVVVAYVLK